MRGLHKIAEAVGGLRDRVHAMGQRRSALASTAEVAECVAGLERHTSPRVWDSSPLAGAIDRELAEAGELPAVAARVLSEHVGRMTLCPGGERLRGALLRCLGVACGERRAYRAAEVELRSAVGEVDSEIWRRGHGGARTALGMACGMLGELTPEGSAQRLADSEAMAARLALATKRPVPVVAHPAAARAEAALVDAVEAVSEEEVGAAEITVEVRRRLPGEGPYYPEGAPRHSDNTGWTLADGGRELYDWEGNR